MSFIADLGARLSAAGVATTSAGSTGWRLCLRGLLESPDRCVGLLPTGGFQQDGIAPIDRPTAQVLVRGAKTDGAEVEAKMAAVCSALNLQSSALTGWTYVDLQKQGDVLWLGWDELQRPMYSVNFLALRSRTS